MNYQRIYDELIARAVTRGTVEGYSERHHIVPRCLGGSDERGNLVDLTAREHLVAHLLLAKMYPQEQGLIFAAFLMSHDPKDQGYKVHSRVYEMLRVRYSQMASEQMVALQKDPEFVEKRHSALIEATRRPEFREKTGKRMRELVAQGKHPMQNPAIAAKVGAVVAAYYKDPEFAERMRAAVTKRMRHPDMRAAMRAKANEQFADPIQRAKHREAHNCPELREARSAQMTKLSAQGLHPMQNPIHIAKHREALSRPEVRAAMSAATKTRYEDPAHRAATSATSAAAWDARHATAGTTRPVIKPPVKPGTSKARIWAICDELTAELGYAAPRHLVVERAAERGLNRGNSQQEYNTWSIYQRQQASANQEQRVAA